MGNKFLVSSELIRNQVVSPPIGLDEANDIIFSRYRDILPDTDKEYFIAAIDTDKFLSKERKKLMKKVNYLQISLPIAAAVTAYARMLIYKYKDFIIKNGGVLYYSDTDSIFSSIPLPADMISDELGQMKLEYVATSEKNFVYP